VTTAVGAQVAMGRGRTQRRNTPRTVNTSAISPLEPGLPQARRMAVAVMAVAIVATAACGGDNTAPSGEIKLSSITIDSSRLVVDRGVHVPLTATVRDSRLEVVTVPLVWRSSNERVATIENGKLFARDTGATLVTASSLGVTSAAMPVTVTWLGAAKVAPLNWTAPAAVTPATTVTDSIRVFVTNLAGQPVAKARVAFALAGGGGSITPAVDTTGPNGIASARWITGASVGPNTVTATVVGDDDTPLAWVTDNGIRFAVNAYQALAVVAGDAQTAVLLAPLPVIPRVRLVDPSGQPRAGVPIAFAASGGGRVVTATVSTDADGKASPGVWTLGETPGDQTLTATVESASIALHAMATGTAVHYSAPSLVAGGSVTCALRADAKVDCWGESPKVGDGTFNNRTVPTPTSGNIQFASLAAGTTHVCGIDPSQAIYCWGVNALVDTSGHVVQASVPTALPSSTVWRRVATGRAHTCALATDNTPYCWGDDTFGQLGDGVGLVRFVPQPVAGGFHFANIVSGADHACGLTDAGQSYCWGRNQNGQLGDATTTTRVTPTATTGGLAFVALGAGQAWTCGLTSTGSAYCWGSVAGVSTAQTTPRAYTTPRAFTTLSVGGAHACALSANGEAYCWGDNSFGQLGDSTTTTRTDPTLVAGGLRFTSITAGDTHTCGVSTTGDVACWGLNRAGEVGDSLVTVRLVPRYLIIGVTP